MRFTLTEPDFVGLEVGERYVEPIPYAIPETYWAGTPSGWGAYDLGWGAEDPTRWPYSSGLPWD